MDKLYIVIPAYNEAENIVSVAKEWHEIVKKINGNSRLVILDDGSKDNTYSILTNLKNELPQLVIMTKMNSGHGSTILYGYHYALIQQADYIFQTDADRQTVPSEFWEFWESRLKYPALIGCRKKRKDGLSRIFISSILKIVLMCIFKVIIPDANSPFRLMRSDILKKYIVKIPTNFFLSNVLLSVLLVKNEKYIPFIPISFLPRQGGVNSIKVKNLIKIGWQSIIELRRAKKQIK